jgi:hypothetical protein
MGTFEDAQPEEATVAANGAVPAMHSSHPPVKSPRTRLATGLSGLLRRR